MDREDQGEHYGVELIQNFLFLARECRLEFQMLKDEWSSAEAGDAKESKFKNHMDFLKKHLDGPARKIRKRDVPVSTESSVTADDAGMKTFKMARQRDRRLRQL